MTAESKFHPSTITQVSPPDMINRLIEMIVAEVAADMVCVCSYQPDQSVMEVLAHHVLTGDDDLSDESYTLLQGLMRQLPVSGEPRFFDAKALKGTGYGTALAFPLSLPDEIIGVLALFSLEKNAFTDRDIERIALPVNMIRTVVENLLLYEALAQSLIVSQSIALTARTLADNPSPQDIIDVLSSYLFDIHVTSCALMLYGPVREDRPFGPFDYLEMKGSWSKRRGSAVALGTKIYLKDYPDILKQLDERIPLVFDSITDFAKRLDPFSRSLLKAERIASLTILPLHAGQRKLGVILVGTNKPHRFLPRELQNYQAVSEFLAISAMSQVLQQQHDLVQQGRSALLEAVTDGVVMVLPDDAGGRVLTMNNRFTRMFNLPQKTLPGQLLKDVLKAMQIPENVRRELQTVWLSMPVRDPGTQRGEFHMIHNEGVHMDIEWYSAPVYQDNHVLGRIHIFHDVTPERTARRLRSAFLSRISHELRTPLTSIQGFAEFILEVQSDQLPDLAREYTQIILSSAKHLRAIFTDMIEMTRADAGELKLNMRDLHLPDIIIDVVARMEPQLKKKEQVVVMDLDDLLPPIHADADRIAQVVTNLVNNAIKYSPGNSQIMVKTEYITEPADLPDDAPVDIPLPTVLVSVIDEGEGLTRDTIDQVFMPFFRTEKARVQQIEGAGLGLAVSRSIIELHRGVIWAAAATREKPGGRFMFTLPPLGNRP